METKRNLKYFTSKGINPLILIGVVVMIVGVALLALGRFRMKLVGCVLAVVGLGVIIFVSGGIASGDDIEYACAEREKDLTERGMKRFTLFEKHLKFQRPQVIHGYEFNDEVYYKKGSDGKNRTSVYAAAILFFTLDHLYIHGRRFSFVDDLLDEEFGDKYLYDDLDHAEVQEHPFARQVGKHNIHFTDYHFVIVAKNGTNVLDMSVEYGADTDKLVEDVNRLIEIRSKDYEDRQARKEKERAERLAAAAEAAKANA